jgi:hypothetical protein
MEVNMNWSGKILRIMLYPAVMLVLMFISQGCDTTQTTGGSVSLSFAPGIGVPKVNADIQLTEVKILLRDVKLEKESDGKPESEDGSDETETENVKVGPFVVHLNLAGTTTDFVVNNIPAGIYDELKFEIHKLEASETPPDPEFKEGDDSSQRYSVIVKGFYNSNSFVYKSRKSAHQHLEFENMLVIEDNTSTNLTITVDPNTWFYNNGVLMDPTDPANENDIDNNIERSFKKAFEDRDHDGEHD